MDALFAERAKGLSFDATPARGIDLDDAELLAQIAEDDEALGIGG